MKGEQTYPAKITLLFDEHKGLEIEVTDGLSGIRICEVTVAPAETVALLSRRAYVDGTVTLPHPVHAPIGYASEHRTETVDFTDVTRVGAVKYETYNRDAAVDRIVQYLKDAGLDGQGWRLTRGSGTGADWNNHHNHVIGKAPVKGRDFYRIHFSRHVNPQTGAVWQWTSGVPGAVPAPAPAAPDPDSSTPEDILLKG